jgi:hypothetical protein
VHQSSLTSDASRLQVNLEIALSGVSAKVKPFNHPLPGRKYVGTSDHVIKSLLRDPRILSRRFSEKLLASKWRQTHLCG